MKIYAALYTDCTWESDYGIISLHLSKESAEKAVDSHKNKIFSRMSGNGKFEIPKNFSEHMDWMVREYEILP